MQLCKILFSLCYQYIHIYIHTCAWSIRTWDIYIYILIYCCHIGWQEVIYIYIYRLTLWVMFRRNRTTLYAGYKMTAIITSIHPFTIREIIIKSNFKALQSEHKCLYTYAQLRTWSYFFICFASKLEGFVTREMRVVFHDTYMRHYA